MRLILGVVLVGLGFLVGVAEAQGDGPRVLLDDFEKDPATWGFVGGEEFPGAKGSLSIDATVAHGGKRSCKLAADFTGGGAYVGAWRDLASLKGQEFKEIRLWVKAGNVASVGVRIIDASDQCHQTRVALPPHADTDWQQLV